MGAGYTAKEHARAFAAVPGVALVGVFSRTRPRAEALASLFNIVSVCSSLEELHDTTRADLVVVTVNEPEMRTTAEACFRYPWAVLLEKPPGLNVEEAEAIRDAGSMCGGRVRVALNRQSFGVTRAVREALSTHSGARFVKVQDQENPEAARVAGTPKEVVDNWMYANSIHMVDYFRLFAVGNVESVEHVIPYDPQRQPCIAVAKITFDSGDTGLYEAVWNGPGPWSVSVTIPGRRWELRPLEHAVAQALGGKPESVSADPWDTEFKPGFRYQAQQAVALARGSDTDLATLDDALKTMRLIREIYGR